MRLFAPIAFLALSLSCAKQVPLKVTTITPNDSGLYGQTSAISLRNRDAFTVVFSRSVIAMGSDFGAASPALLGALPTKEQAAASNLPLYATASGAAQPVPGKLRWVTTYIARFDPDTNWPLDLKFEIIINPNLKAWDGTKLTVAEDKSTRSFQTDQLRGGGWSKAYSKQAAELTSYRWDSTVCTHTRSHTSSSTIYTIHTQIEPATGAKPECPPDGK